MASLPGGAYPTKTFWPKEKGEARRSEKAMPFWLTAKQLTSQRDKTQAD
jgi:hypothetical protein